MMLRTVLGVGSMSLVFGMLGACLAPGANTNEDAQKSGDALAAPIANGLYNLHMVATGKCLDVSGSSTDNGAKVQEWDCNGTGAQVFQVTQIDSGYYEITNAHSGKSLDITNVSTQPNAPLQQWAYGGGANQQFSIVDQGNGQFSLHPRHTGMALDLYWGNAADGTPIVQYPYWGGSNQLWTFQSLGGGSTPAPPAPTPPPASGPLPTRLRVTNQCSQPIWLAHSDNVPDAANVRINQGQSHDVAIPDGGLSATRVWPKIGCDGNGANCTIGESVAPCPAGGCQPPVDSKFEATFAPKGGAAQTWYNLSQVDGYTLPFKVVPHGNGAEQGGCVTSDCSHLSLDACPGDEDLSGQGAQQSYAHEDLRIRDGQGKVIGCLSPCKKWNYPAPWGLGQSESADPGLHLCCPTPIDPNSGQCTEANACMTSGACRNTSDPLSVTHTQYVAAIHAMCPSAYSYSYDDAAGLHNCPSDTGFEVVFCP